MADLMNPGGGLTNSKLALATADSSDVVASKTFYAGNKEIKAGTLDLASATAKEKDVLSGKSFYAGDKQLRTGTMNGWVIADLGVGKSFNVSKYPGYKSFTSSNFICEPQSIDWTGGNTWVQGDIKPKAALGMTKSYSSSSGVLTAEVRVRGGWGDGILITGNVRAYLKYRP